MSFVRQLFKKVQPSVRSIYDITSVKRFYNDISFQDIPEVSSTTLKQILKSKNVNFEEGFTCFKIQCTFCKDSLPKKVSDLYINKTTGFFICSSCSRSGQWSLLNKMFVNKNNKSAKLNEFFEDQREYKSNWIDLEKNCSNIKDFESSMLEKICKEFSIPNINDHVKDCLKARIDKAQENLYFPLENSESQIVGYKSINKFTKVISTNPIINCSGVLLGKVTKTKDNMAIVVPNIADFLTLLNAKITGNIICLPYGLTCLPLHILPALEKYNKLILWFGNDVTAWDIARNFAKKLCERRCYFVRPTDQQPLPHLAQGLDLKQIVSSAQPIWHKSITTFSSLRQDVLSDLQNIDKVQGIKWKRYPTLNKILKGHRRGELTVITGPTGSGKTTFISEYSLDLAMQGVNTLWGSFEIRNVRLARTMLQQMSGIPLDEHLHVFDEWADKFEQLPIYFMTFHGQQTIKIVMEAVEHATYVHDIAHVIIDNVQFMMGMSEESKHYDRFWKQDVIIAAFRSFATRKNCHVSLVIHPRKERESEDLTTSSIFGGAKASQEADNVLIIQDKRLTSLRGKKYLQVAKNRYSGDLGVMALDFDKSSLSYAQKKKKAAEEKEVLPKDAVML